MSETRGTFSEVWYRVANQVVTLRPRVGVRRQVFRGERWYVLHDPFNNQFFRLRRDAYTFIARLRPDRTIDEVWREAVEENPHGAPGQEEVIQLLAQLYHANLLHYRSAGDGEQFFERYKKRRQRERMFTWWNLMFARFPLFDPDVLLNRMLPVIRVLMRPWAALVWLLVVGLAVKTCVDHYGELATATADVLAPDNLLLLYAGLVFLKVLHEFGHAAACKHFGGEVHTMGIMLLVFSPLPYVDVTSSWAFRERWKRVAVASAGMVAELFVAALAALVWAEAGPGVLRELAFNMMLAAGVTTLVFNANPLLRYDGYYILSDLADLPNLYQRGQQMLMYWCKKYILAVRKAKPPVVDSARERAWLGAYGVFSLVYRIFVFAGLIWFVSGQFLLLGLVTAIFCAVAWGGVPLVKLTRYLANGPELDRGRPRAVAGAVGAVALVLLVLGVMPAPQTLRAPGVLRPAVFGEVTPGVDGVLAAIEAPSGTVVEAGQPLVRLRNEELEFEIAAARAQKSELESLWRSSLQSGSSSRAALEQGLEAVSARVKMLEERAAQLVVTAPRAGRWVAPSLDQATGAWVQRGTALGQVIDPAAGFDFTAVVAQGEASRLFEGQIGSAVVRLRGQSGEPLPVTGVVAIQAEQTRLPSPALAISNGGEVQLARDAGDEWIAAEPFYEVRAAVAATADVALLAGLTGRVAFELPARPLAWQWLRLLRQALQKRATN